MPNTTKIYHIKIDLEGKYAYVNKYFKQKFEFIHQRFEGELCISSIFKGDMNVVATATQNLLTNKSKIERLEFRKPKPDGTFFWTYWEFTLDHDTQQKPKGIECIGFDITESVHLEIQNENLLQALNKSQEISATATFMYEIANNKLSSSDQLVAIFQIDSQSNDILHACLSKIHPDDKPQFYSIKIEKIKQKNGLSFAFRILDEKFAHAVKYLETILNYYINPITKIEYVVGSVIDTTKLRKKEQDLTLLISHLNSILDNNEKSISVINREFKLVSYNKVSLGIAESFNLPLAVGDSIVENLPAEYKEKFTGYYQRVFAGERISVSEVIMYPSGHFLDEIEYYPIFNKDNTVDFIVINCAFHCPQGADLQKNTSKLGIAKSIIDYQEVEKDRIARELHDGVNQLLFAAQIHISSSKSKDVHLRKSIELIDLAIKEVKQIVNNSSHFLLNYVSFEEALDEYLNMIFNNTTIEFTLKYLTQISIAKNLELQSFRIIQEIVQNVIKHSKATIFVLKIRVNRGYLTISTGDNGKGFDHINVPRGEGLNNIVNRVILLNGSIKLHSKLGFGTIYIIKMPLVIKQ